MKSLFVDSHAYAHTHRFAMTNPKSKCALSQPVERKKKTRKQNGNITNNEIIYWNKGTR